MDRRKLFSCACISAAFIICGLLMRATLNGMLATVGTVFVAIGLVGGIATLLASPPAEPRV